jgi:glutaminyl-peptide cyclotransferase
MLDMDQPEYITKIQPLSYFSRQSWFWLSADSTSLQLTKTCKSLINELSTAGNLAVLLFVDISKPRRRMNKTAKSVIARKQIEVQPRKSSCKTERKKRSTVFPCSASNLIVVAGIVALILAFGNARNPAAKTAPETGARRLDFEVVNDYPHDPGAFLQGLLWHEGYLYESTGLYGQSTLRRVDLPTGRILKSISLPSELFGEGLAMVDDRLIQLTWKSRLGFVYDRNSFSLVRRFNYKTEGWGLTYDGKMLIMSDGSSYLTYLDPGTFAPVRRMAVTVNGHPVDNLNELEFIEGMIWSNVWQTSSILCIDPTTGHANSYLDLRGILPDKMRTGREDVLNGIAYDARQKRIFVSGKLWPRIFEIRVK